MALKENESFGVYIASLRKKSGLTQQEVAMRLGVANKTVSKWECGRGYPDITLLPALADIFSVSVDELLTGEMNIISSGAHPSGPQAMQVSKVVQYQNHSVYKPLNIAIGLSLFSLILFFVLEKYLLLPFLCAVIMLLCIASLALVRMSYRKAMHALQKADLQMDYKSFISAFGILYAMAISLALCSCLQITIYLLWVKSNINVAFPIIVALLCSIAVFFIIIVQTKTILLAKTKPAS